MCAKTMRPTYVRARVGSRMSGSWLRAITSVFFWACAVPASSPSATSETVTRANACLIARMGESSDFAPSSQSVCAMARMITQGRSDSLPAGVQKPMAASLLVTTDMARRWALAMVLLVLVGGCAGRRTVSEPADTHPAASPASPIASHQRVVAYPHGRWLLYGDGSAASPYTWVWVPTGATPQSSAPPVR